VLKKFVPDAHYLVQVVKKQQYQQTLDRLFALRNFAAHESRKGKAQAKAALGMNLAAASAWAKRQNRFLALCTELRALASEIQQAAPY